jgi:hypothetical protein
MFYHDSVYRRPALTPEQAANLALCAEAAKIAIEREKERKRLEQEREDERLRFMWKSHWAHIKTISPKPPKQ